MTIKLRLKNFRYCSASQVKTYVYSPRKWYLEKRVAVVNDSGKDRDMPVKRRSNLGFGNVLHACAERYLLADDNVSLRDCAFPEAAPVKEWGRHTGEYARWDAELESPVAEGALVRELLEEGIEKGYLDREPDREIEFSFNGMEFVDGVSFMGYIDYLTTHEPRIIDHKTTKSFRYTLSKPKMKTDPQLMLYCRALLMLLEHRGLPEPKSIEVSHVYYLKDARVPKGQRVKKKTIKVTPEHVREQWAKLEEIGHAMVRDSKVEIEHFRNVECGGEECSYKYGGCPFVLICAGEETIEEYVQRLDKAAELDRIRAEEATRLPPDAVKAMSQGDKNMTNPLLERLKAAKANKEMPKPPTAPSAPAPAETPAEEYTAPPWAHEGCPGCGGSGWNAAGEPCNICVGIAKKKGRPYPGDGSVEVTGLREFTVDGKAAETPTEEAQETPSEPQEPEPQPEEAQEPEPASEPQEPASGKPQSLKDKLAAKRAASGKAPAPSKPKPPKSEPTPPPAEGDDGDDEETKKRGRGRPKGSKNKPKDERTFILLIGSAPVRTDRPVLDVADLLHRAGEELAQATGADSFYAMGGQERRDMLSRRAPAIAKEIPEGAVVFSTHHGFDTDALVNALVPFASTVTRASR